MVEVIIGILGSALAAVSGWAFVKISGLDTRVAVLEADKVSLRELLQVHLAEITRRLEHIERNLEELKKED